jgi:hypothetical protein
MGGCWDVFSRRRLRILDGLDVRLRWCVGEGLGMWEVRRWECAALVVVGRGGLVAVGGRNGRECEVPAKWKRGSLVLLFRGDLLPDCSVSHSGTH